MHLRLLLLVAFVTVAKCYSEGMSMEEACESPISLAIWTSLRMETPCRELPKTSQPSSRSVLNEPMTVSEFFEFERVWGPIEEFTPNVTCPSNITYGSVKLSAENETLHCSLADSEEFRYLAENCAYSVTFHYEDKRIFEYAVQPNKSYPISGNTLSFDTLPGSGIYPNFSMTFEPKPKPNRGLSSFTLDGIYQCSVQLSPSESIDSNAIYYRSETNALPLMSTKRMDQSLIGKQLKCDLDNFKDDYCKSTFNRLRPIVNLIALMELTEVKHMWNPEVDSRIKYSLRYYQTGSERVYQAECRINGDMRVNIEEDLPGEGYRFGYAERVCFGINHRYVGCYLRWSNGNHSIWNAAEDDKFLLANVMIKKVDRIEHDKDSGKEQVFTVLMKNLSSQHRRFWCVKTFIIGRLLSEHTFESNYLSKPEAKLLQNPDRGEIIWQGI